MRKLGIGSALALMGVIALVAGGIALATSGDGTEVRQVDEDTGARGEGRGPEGFREHFREKREEFAKALGEELDKPTEEVLAALKNIFRKRLDQAVEDGNLTREQADKIIECHDSGDCGPGEFHRGGPPGVGGGPPGFGGGPPPGFGGPPDFMHRGGPPGL